MTKTTLGVIFIFLLALSALANAGANSVLAKPAKSATKKLTCEAATKKYPKLTSSDCSERGDWPASAEAGSAEINVIDEDNNTLSDFCVRVNGKILKRAPRSSKLEDKLPPQPEDKLSVFPLEPGTKVIEVQRDDVGGGCQEIEIKPGELSKVAFQFFRLREKVTQVNTTVMERQYYGSIVVKNELGDDTEVFVDPSNLNRNEGDLNSWVSKGSGSLKISNLTAGDYDVVVRRKIDMYGTPPCNAKCQKDATLFERRVTLENCKTVVVDAPSKEPKPSPESTAKEPKQSPVSKTCEEPEKDKKKKSAAAKRKPPARAHRFF